MPISTPVPRCRGGIAGIWSSKELASNYFSYAGRKFSSLVKKTLELESDLNDERKQRTSAVTLKTKFELDLNEIKVKLDEVTKSKEECIKQNKKLILTIKEITKENDELKNNKEELSASGKDLEKRRIEMTLLGAQKERDLVEKKSNEFSIE